MKLVTVLKDIPYDLIMGEPNQEVDSIIYDSRIKTASGLFIAIKGFSTDGHQYIGAAIENGAKTIVVEDHVEIQKEGVTVVKVDNTRTIMARLAVNFYDHPSTKLDLVGVTGTNGKTSITFLLGQLLEAYNKKIGIIGTIENRIGRTILKSQHTTPESADLQKLLETMVEEGVSHCLMEVSSHALALHRVDENDFKIGIFTNLTQDHLDFHKTMDAYAEAKAILFSRCQVGVLNEDSSYVHKMKEKATCEIITYGIDNLADYHASQIHVTAQGVTYHLSTPEGAYQVEVPIPGKFTVYNTLAVICTARQLGLPMEFILDHMKVVRGVPGRVQSFSSQKGYSVLVDYAHTPDGLENVLETIKQFVKGRIITVFGCGGDRDNTKRPLMGEVAARYSDEVIITSDNPRSEDPLTILEQVEVGVKRHQVDYVKMEDRKEAICQALNRASEGDVVLIAGKGHENYQILKERIIHFDDSEIVRAFIQGEE
ncbi:MAG: UDP-N-acetylmuramoyl-L-alanyl-D-glutamate--2,6-diaminopimelate ligase [Niameybacter sp.]|uniref:UDP-N-acetylmuramoyl-L-alanyl-D-glutamate--2, 6-diaminopimelate ligase n=1 Tax=Niameybacter sp. TaxID=2033640 RepID=UPI002FC73E92